MKRLITLCLMLAVAFAYGTAYAATEANVTMDITVSEEFYLRIDAIEQDGQTTWGSTTISGTVLPYDPGDPDYTRTIGGTAKCSAGSNRGTPWSITASSTGLSSASDVIPSYMIDVASWTTSEDDGGIGMTYPDKRPLVGTLTVYDTKTAPSEWADTYVKFYVGLSVDVEWTQPAGTYTGQVQITMTE